MLFTKIGSSYVSSEFPDKFSNQLYFSENVSLGEFTYTSAYSVKYVLTGYERYAVEGREVLIKPGQHLLVNNKSQVTTLPAVGKALSIFIDPDTLADVSSIISEKTLEDKLDNLEVGGAHQVLFHEKAYQNENVFTQSMLHKIALTLSHSEHSGEHEIDPSLFFQLSESVILDQGMHSKRLNKLTGVKRSTVQEQYCRLLNGVSYMNDNWNQPFSLAKTASVALLSPYHFHRLFRGSFGKTPYQYHLDVQMSKAVELLREKKLSISEICCVLGYNSPTSFGRTFKKYFGIAPSGFAK